MLLRRSTIVVVLLVLLAGIAAASVSAASAGSGPNLNNLKSGNGGYTVTFGDKSTSAGQNLVIQPMSLNNYITQGQVLWAQKTVSGFSTYIDADLYWGNPSNSLSLTVYTPDGYVYGPYYDNCDGLLNGNIPVQLTKSSGIADGTYYYEIIGCKVTGSQYLTFT